MVAGREGLIGYRKVKGKRREGEGGEEGKRILW